MDISEASDQPSKFLSLSLLQGQSGNGAISAVSRSQSILAVVVVVGVPAAAAATLLLFGESLSRSCGEDGQQHGELIIASN